MALRTKSCGARNLSAESHDASCDEERSSDINVKPSLGIHASLRPFMDAYSAGAVSDGDSSLAKFKASLCAEIGILLEKHQNQMALQIQVLLEGGRLLQADKGCHSEQYAASRLVEDDEEEDREVPMFGSRVQIQPKPEPIAEPFSPSPSHFTLDAEDAELRAQATRSSNMTTRGKTLVVNTARPWQQRLVTVVRGIHWEVFFAVAIFLNSLFIGVEVEYAAQNPGKAPPLSFYIINYTYAALFCAELLLRLCAEGRDFFCSNQWAWNLLDITIVLSALMEVALDVVSLTRDSGHDVDVGNLQVSNVRIIRMLRITRFVRTLRIPRVIRFITALRTLIYSIVATLKSLVWALVLLAMIIYVFAIVFTQSTTDHVLLHGESSLPLTMYWSSLLTSMFTLFKAITGGISWHDVVEPLGSVSVLLTCLFAIFIFFTYFAVLNVVTGVFCQSAIEAAHRDPDLIVHSLIMNKKAYIDKIKNLFTSLDGDDSGHITLKELEKLMKDETLQAHFEALDLDVNDAWTLFKLIDQDNQHTIDIEEFVMGCMKLRGTAKTMDMARLQADNRWLMKRLSRFKHTVDQKLERIHQEQMIQSRLVSPEVIHTKCLHTT